MTTPDKDNMVRLAIKVFGTIADALIMPGYHLTEGPETNRVIGNFIDHTIRLHGGLCPERLVDMCIFVAYRFRNRFGRIPQMFSSSMVNKYLEMNHAENLDHDAWLDTGGFKRGTFYAMIKRSGEHPLKRYIFLPAEESLKQRLQPDRAQMLLCVNHSTAWTPLSPTCRKCVHKDECKKETEKRYPELYKVRCNWREHYDGTEYWATWAEDLNNNC